MEQGLDVRAAASREDPQENVDRRALLELEVAVLDTLHLQLKLPRLVEVVLVLVLVERWRAVERTRCRPVERRVRGEMRRGLRNPRTRATIDQIMRLRFIKKLATATRRGAALAAIRRYTFGTAFGASALRSAASATCLCPR